MICRKYNERTIKLNINKKTKEVLAKSKKEIAPKLKKLFGEENYNEYCISSWEQQINLMSTKEILVKRIVAKKK